MDGVLAEIRVRRGDRVAERRPADRVDPRDPRFERSDVARERHVNPRLVREVEDKRLVERVRRADEVERRGLDASAQRPHAAAVVDEQADRHRDVVAPEQRDPLTLPVLVDAERALVEIGHLDAARIPDRRVQDDETRLDAERRRLLGGG